MYFTGGPYKEKYKKNKYEYIVIFIQGQVSLNYLWTFYHLVFDSLDKKNY